MILRKSEAENRVTGGSHDGVGKIAKTTYFSQGEEPASGFRLIRKNVLEPGSTIGRHTHQGTEELWLVLEGRARVIDDGEEAELGPGDANLVRDGGTHELTVLGDQPLRMLIIGTSTGQD